jgi:hypothetical protein
VTPDCLRKSAPKGWARQWSGFDVRPRIAAHSEGERQIQSSTGFNILPVVFDSNIRKVPSSGVVEGWNRTTGLAFTLAPHLQLINYRGRFSPFPGI